MVCERGWGGQAADSDWSVRSPHPFWNGIRMLSPQVTLQIKSDTTKKGKKILGDRVSSKQKFRFKPKQTETQSVSVDFRMGLVHFCVSNPYRNNRNKQINIETNKKKMHERSNIEN
jgi:hypothetical protein